MNGQQVHRSPFARHQPSTHRTYSHSESISSLPQTFISSLRQLFSILDKTNCGYVPFELFKRYFDGSAPTLDFLNELELESRSNNYYITFNLLLNVISRTLSTAKRPPFIRIPQSTRSSAHSTGANLVNSEPKHIEREIPVAYRSSDELEHSFYHAPSSAFHPNHSSRHNSTELSMIRSRKRFEVERSLLIQTCDTLDRVKFYLTNRLLDMKEKRKSYCHHLAAAETTGLTPESMYNRDLVADLLKLAYTVLVDANYDFKKSFDHSSSSSSCSSANGIHNQYEKQLKEKDGHIRQLETEKRVLLKELIEMKHQYGTVLAVEIS